MDNERSVLYHCCIPLVNENETIKKLKPFLLLSLLFLLIIIFLDYFLFETNIYVYLSFSIFPIFILAVKRYYFMYTLNMIYFLFIIFPKIINDIGTYFQIEILTSATIIILLLKIFCLILLIMIQYFFFLYYKELKYQWIIERPRDKHVYDENNNESEKEKFVNNENKKLSNIITEQGEYHQ